MMMKAKTVNETIGFERNRSSKESIGIGEAGKLMKKYGTEIGTQIYRLQPILDEYKFFINYEDLNRPIMIIFSRELDSGDLFTGTDDFTIYTREKGNLLVGEYNPASLSSNHVAKGATIPLKNITRDDFEKWFGSPI